MVGLPATLLQTKISQKTFELNVVKFWTVIHGPQRMNPVDFGEPLTFALVPPAG